MMRADDHQFIQPLYISSFGERSAEIAFDEEKHGWAGSSRARSKPPIPCFRPPAK